MMYILFLKGQPVHVTYESPFTGTPALKPFIGIEYDQVKDHRDFKSLEEVQALADHFNEVGVLGRGIDVTGEKPFFLAHDNGDWTSHRFGIFEPPKLGDKVSYGFNGDFYPCGEIVRITPGWKIITSSGKAFNRRKASSTWLMVGGTWSLVQGVHSRLNPEF
jgi:hypothetical protein